MTLQVNDTIMFNKDIKSIDSNDYIANMTDLGKIIDIDSNGILVKNVVNGISFYVDEFEIQSIDEDELLYYLGWFMSGQMRCAGANFQLHYQYEALNQLAYMMIQDEFGYTFNEIWNLCREN